MSGLTCQDARNLFDAHLNGELRSALETELNAHRLRCPACRHELALLEVAGDVIAADDGALGLDDEFSTRLMACVSARRDSRQHRRWNLLALGGGVLAAAACIAFAVLVFSRPAPRVAGARYVAPRAGDRQHRPDAPDVPAAVEQTVSPAAPFQAQLERALTELRKNASSLRKMYQFITPQIHEEMGLERPDRVHDQPDGFEPGQAAPRPEDGIAPHPIIEDI